MPDIATRFAPLSLPKAFPSSQKRYLTGSRSDLQVPYREITLSPTLHSQGIDENPPLPVYDSSGPFSDPDCSVDIAQGLPKLRRRWIEERSDTELLACVSSEYGRQRANDLLTFDLRFPSQPRPRRALRGRNVTQMYYALRGIVTPEMEFVALRESMRLASSCPFRSRFRRKPTYPNHA
jgi:phosphomethylpyrimidine synthase